jgi:putative Ca2+/H+ antiporter (TMEM165/GDT1 family)
MDALMAAFVGALLCQASDRTAWLAAIMADRYHQPSAVIVAATIALALGNALGAVAGTLIAPIMTPNARALFLAIALVSAGGGAFFPLKAPDRMTGWRIGALATSLVAMLTIGMGDRAQFLTAALAARTPGAAAFAAVGATLGSIAIIVPAIIAGERSFRSLPHRPIRAVIGLILVLTGVIVGLGALRLI